jgi:hypothetical protein
VTEKELMDLALHALAVLPAWIGLLLRAKVKRSQTCLCDANRRDSICHELCKRKIDDGVARPDDSAPNRKSDF